MPSKNSFTFKLNLDQQNLLADVLRQGNYRPVNVPHTKIAVKTPDCSISLYNSGKCLIQGKGAEEFISFVMEPLVLQSVELGYEDLANPDESSPHMGIDESGKGDLFGPLVVVGAYVDEGLVSKMRDMDVRDSKTITSDNKALDMGRALRGLLGNKFSVVKIGPSAYNRLYTKMRSVNTMLGWAHARAIENLLENVPTCPRAISDQFGSKKQVEQALLKKGRDIELIQRHKAESDVAVAAASIIARELFLRGLYDMKQKYGREFPKGASARVLKAVGKNRSCLGPDGQAMSRASKWRKKERSSEAG
jgi:ribonuclease HIII